MWLGCGILARQSAGRFRLRMTFWMWKSLRRRWEKRRVRILLSRKQRIQLFLGLSGRTKSLANFPRRRLTTWLVMERGLGGCGRSRNFWCIGGLEFGPLSVRLRRGLHRAQARLPVLLVAQ